MGQPIDLVVISTTPSGPVIINSSTQVNVSEETAKAPAAVKEGGVPSITYEDIGGLRNEVTKVREIIRASATPSRTSQETRRRGTERRHIAWSPGYWQNFAGKSRCKRNKRQLLFNWRT